MVKNLITHGHHAAFVIYDQWNPNIFCERRQKTQKDSFPKFLASALKQYIAEKIDYKMTICRQTATNTKEGSRKKSIIMAEAAEKIWFQ